MSTVKIGGVSVDVDDPCALLPVLKGAYYRMLAGETRIEVRHGDTAVRNAVSNTNLTELKAVIERLEIECARVSNTRRRFAKGVRWRRQR